MASLSLSAEHLLSKWRLGDCRLLFSLHVVRKCFSTNNEKDGSDLNTSYDGMSKTRSHQENPQKILVITCYVMIYADIDFNGRSGVLGRVKE